MNNEKLIEFLTELTKLTYKYEFQIGGCVAGEIIERAINLVERN